MQVYPAAGLVGYAPVDARIFYIDPRPTLNYELSTSPGFGSDCEGSYCGVPEVVMQMIK
jgi:NAD-dependent deacetylase